MKPLIDINDLATLLKLRKGTLYNLVYLRRIPFVKVGRALRFNPADVDQIVRIVRPSDQAAKGRRS